MKVKHAQFIIENSLSHSNDALLESKNQNKNISQDIHHYLLLPLYSSPI
jgi:hypothetical protein